MPVSAQEVEAVRIGMSAPLTGPNAAYGSGLLHGLRLGLASLRGGSLDGRRVELLVLDDAGDPQRAGTNTVEFLTRGVVALTGYHGARSIEAALSQPAADKIPFVGVSSSADSLRSPEMRQVFNLRAGAADEIGKIVQHFDTLAAQRIAVLAQDDTLGAAGLDGLKIELARLAMRPDSMLTLSAQAGEPEVVQAVTRMCASAPDAALLALEARLAMAAVRSARRAGCAQTRFATMSETGAALAGAADAYGLAVAQVLPHPAQLSHPLVAAYQRALGGDRSAASYPSLEGFVYGRMLAEVLSICGSRRANAACIAEVLNNRPPELPGWKVRFTPQDRRGASYVEMTFIDSQGRVQR